MANGNDSPERSYLSRKDVTAKKKFAFYLIASVIFVFIPLLVFELYFFDFKSGFKNHIIVNGNKLVEHYFEGLYSYDSELGWVPSSNVVKNKWGIQVHTKTHGIRSNGAGGKNQLKRPLILACGGSFTFGDSIPDNDTWPAYLEKLTGYSVLNAGVSSYGLDQTILRAEKLIPIYKPDIIVLGIIYLSFQRSLQTVRHGVPKPYFNIENEELILKNVPVPFLENVTMDPFRSVFGHSKLMHTMMSRMFPAYWWRGTMNDFQFNEVEVKKLSHLMLKRVNDLARNRGVKIVLLFLPAINDQTKEVSFLRDMQLYVDTNLKHLAVLNATTYFNNLKKMNEFYFRGLYQTGGGGHLSKFGNHYTSTLLKEFIFKK